MVEKKKKGKKRRNKTHAMGLAEGGGGGGFPLREQRLLDSVHTPGFFEAIISSAGACTSRRT